MRKLILLCLAVITCHSAYGAVIATESAKETVVKIFANSITPDYHEPWRMLGPRNSSGTGVVISGNRILTNAHVIANSRFIQIKKYGDAKKTTASVLFVSHDADLAILSVDDDDFFEGIKPLKFGKLPKAQEQVSVLGYPMGGNSLSITQGVLSRIEHRTYVHSGQTLLAGQLDAAINPGNSGGPVIHDNLIVGIVMQVAGGANLGYMVPPKVINHFLEDIKDGTFDGIPHLPLVTQTLENKGMKKKFEFPDTQTGILVVEAFDNFENDPVLREDDIITHIGDHEIADDGTVEFRKNERTSGKYYVDQKHVGDTISLGIFRDGKNITADISLVRKANDYRLVNLKEFDRKPRYLIYGGIVFTPLTINLLERWGKNNWHQKAPFDYMTHLDTPVSQGKTEIVVALKVLPAEVNDGYHGYSHLVMKTVNGQEFTNFAEFTKLLEENDLALVTFGSARDLQIVVDVSEHEKALPTILRDYGIPAPFNLK